ncbi:hypothetical protein COO60DRAFT_1640330 [Scenedesmus sp. NREL 46B-D3]|nr:hypothetical protein COO60DRAFT_1640330 [Scenedesmus sp. NREL 46B-D3]
MRKEGRLQISGPNINIPKKLLRAQWPAMLQRSAPQDVTAHVFVDSTDSYIACAAKIILTKAKAEPVFYLSGLSQLLKSFSGSSVTVELLPEHQVVRLNIATGQASSRPASMSTNTAAAMQQGEQHAEASSAAPLPLHARDAAAATDAGEMQPLQLQAEQQQAASGLRRGPAATPSPRKSSAAAAAAARQGSSSMEASAVKASAVLLSMAAGRLQDCCSQSELLEGMASSVVAAQAAVSPAVVCSGAMPEPAAGLMLSQQLQRQLQQAKLAAAAAVAGGSSSLQHLPGTPGSDAGLWLLADHAAQLQAAGSSGNLSCAESAAAQLLQLLLQLLPLAQQRCVGSGSSTSSMLPVWNEELGQCTVGAAAAAVTAKAAAPASYSSGGDGAMECAQQHAEQGGVGGAVAVVKRVARGSAKQHAAAATVKQQQQQQQQQQRRVERQPAVDAAWPDQGCCHAARAAAAMIAATAAMPSPALPAEEAEAAPGGFGSSKTSTSLQLLSGALLMSAEWAPALPQHFGSPTSPSSSHSRLLGGCSSSSAPCGTPSSCSPAFAAAGTAAAAAAGVAASSKGEAQVAAALARAQQAEQHWQQQQQFAGSSVPPSTAAAAQGSPSPMPAGVRQQQEPDADIACDGTSAAAAAAAAAGIVPELMISSRHVGYAADAAAAAAAGVGVDGGWPLLPDADNLLVVGKALVQVMNLLGAGSAARVALTRSLRAMSRARPRDSCRRRALPEVRLILNEVAGMDCFQPAAAAVDCAAGGAGSRGISCRRDLLCQYQLWYAVDPGPWWRGYF